MIIKASCVIMALVTVSVQSSPVFLPTTVSVSSIPASFPPRTRLPADVVPTITITTEHSGAVTATYPTQTNEQMIFSRTQSTPNANGFTVPTSTSRLRHSENDDASLSLLSGIAKGTDTSEMAGTKLLKQSTAVISEVIASTTSTEMGRTSKPKTESERASSTLMTTHGGRAQEIPFSTRYVEPALAKSPTADTEHPDTGGAGVEESEFTTESAEHGHTPGRNTDPGVWTPREERQNGGTPKELGYTVHSSSGSNPPVTMSLPQTGDALKSLQLGTSAAAERDRIPSLNTLLKTVSLVKSVLENLEIFSVENLRKMCAIHGIPQRFSTGCMKVNPSLPSIIDNMVKIHTTKTTEESIYVELQAGSRVFKSYEILVNNAQIHLCSVFVGHRCPITCDVMADYSSFSHLETKFCSMQGVQLLLNGAINIMAGVATSASAVTQNSGLDDSIWNHAYPELQILTGLTHEVKLFINILRKITADS